MLIESQGLTRRFDERLAVDNLSFQLAAGQVLALLGPNGAGKTTTMRMLSGLLAPSSGSARVCGHALAQKETENDAIRAHCGIVPEAAGFYERLSAADNLRFFAGLQGIDRPEIELRIAFELARFGLTERVADRTGTFSKGMKQRLSLARALLHRPQLLFLDEPTAGLDPKATADLHALIRELKTAGTGIVLSTHSLEEAEAIADEILVLDTQVLFQGRPDDLRRDSQVEVEIELAGELAAALGLPPGIRPMSSSARTRRFAVDLPDRDIPMLVRLLVAADADILRVGRHERGLRDRYLELLSQR
jgi:ABC-2 type transport system ATP-binding protein